MKRAILSLLLGGYRWSLRLYPAAFQAEFGDEMEVVFTTAVREAAAEGPKAVAAVYLKETADFPTNLVDAYRQVPVYAEVGVMKREAKWNVWPAWVGLNLLSIPAAIVAALGLVILIDRIAGPIDWPEAVDVLPPILYISMIILVMSVLQWLLLRRYLPYAGFWIPLTVLGWLSGILVIYLAWLVGDGTAGEWLPALGPPLLGIMIGGFQWLYLRRVIDRAGYWVLASTVGYSVIGIMSLGLFTSMLEFSFYILAPFAITGLALFLLLRLNSQTGEDDRTIPTTDSLTGERQSIWLRRLAMALLAGLLLVSLFFAGSWIFATGQLTLAKAKGIYATPEEGMKQEIIKFAGEYPVERVEILSAGVNANDGSLPRVWYVRAWVFADQRWDGKPTPRGYGGLRCFLRVEDGWVHMSEGAAEFAGWVMELYGLEGA
jgi:hypothetical protein